MTLHDAELTRTEKLNSKEIFEYYKKAKRKFYLRPKYFARISFYLIKHPKELANYFIRFISKIKNEI